MTTTSVFPGALDSFTDPAATSKCNGSNTTGPVVTHAAMHTLENDAIAALQSKVGINSSTDHNSLDYKIASALAGILALQGTSLLYGSGAPASGIGVDGNFYLDDSAHMLYGPKASGTWPAGVSLVGTPGTNGTPGPANTLSIGTVLTGAAGSSAAATITGTAPSQTLNLMIPRGDTGAAGSGGSGSGVGTIYFP